jgi:ABC-type antimicrobial peptide transport system permease subunit
MSWRDFKKQKVKAVFGIGGIFISIMLLATVGILIDSLSYSYLDVATAQTGSADIMFTKQMSTDLTFDLYFDQNEIEDKLDIDDIDYFYPRILMIVNADPLGDEEQSANIIMYGINSTREQDSGRMGDLLIVDPNTMEETSEVFQGPIEDGKCIILKNTASLLNVTKGDWVILTYTSYEINVTIQEICVQKLRFTAIETNLIIMELPQAQEFLDEEGKINYMMATLKNREQIYDTRDVDKTTEKIREIGNRIQVQIGLDYMITLPKMQQLEMSEMITMMMQVMMVFISVLSMLISAVLINSILTTSIEERIREFGVLRVLGGKRRESVFMVLFQGLFIGLFGTILGIAAALMIVPPLLPLIFNLVELISEPIQFIVLPATLIQTFIIGVSITVVISVFPALKAGNIEITRAIDPFRRKEEGYSLKKEGSANTKTIITGISISSVGLLIFILFPRIAVSQNIGIVTSLFIGLLMAVLIGFVFALVGVVPIFEWLLLQVFRPFIRKYYSIVKLALKRNRRRNTGNVVMFALTFSFIFFMSTFLTIRSEMLSDSLEFQYGGDLVIIDQGTDAEENRITLEFLNKLGTIAGVTDAAPIVHNTIDATELLSLVSLASDSSIDQETLLPLFSNAFSQGDKFKTYIGSITAFNQVSCGFIGVNRSYVELSDESQFIWDSASGSNGEDAFDAIFDESRNDTIIIAKNVADYIGVTELGQKVRMTFASKKSDGWSGNATTMEVVGISGGMPGFWNFRSSQFTLGESGVMMSMKNYLTRMDQGSIYNMSTPIDKIIFNIEDHSDDSITDTKSLITDLYGDDYSFIIDDNISKVALFTEGDETIDIIMQIILTLTIFISLFGLISTMYSTMLERMFEIGMLRSLGMRRRNVQGQFMSESMIMMLASGTLGLFIGNFIAWAMVSNIAIISEMPTPWTLDLGMLIRTYLISVGVCIAGIYAITNKIRKWTIMDIFRQTF